MWKSALPLAAALVALARASLAVTPIGDVVQHRDAFANTTVSVQGTVTGLSLGLVGDTAYTLQGSDDYRITVFGRGAAPALGTHLAVTGTVGRKPPDEEFDFPPIILETSRQPQ